MRLAGPGGAVEGSVKTVPGNWTGVEAMMDESRSHEHVHGLTSAESDGESDPLVVESSGEIAVDEVSIANGAWTLSDGPHEVNIAKPMMAHFDKGENCVDATSVEFECCIPAHEGEVAECLAVHSFAPFGMNRDHDMVKVPCNVGVEAMISAPRNSGGDDTSCLTV